MKLFQGMFPKKIHLLGTDNKHYNFYLLDFGKQKVTYGIDKRIDCDDNSPAIHQEYFQKALKNLDWKI